MLYMQYHQEKAFLAQLGLPPLITEIPVEESGEPGIHKMPVSGELMPILQQYGEAIMGQLHRDEGLMEMQETGQLLPLYFTFLGPDDIAVVGWSEKSNEMRIAPIRKIMDAELEE